MKTILLLDTETTGTDDAAVCIEVAVALYSVEHAAVVRSYSSLIRAESNAAESVNRISAALLREAPLADNVWPGIEKLGRGVDAVVCHGTEFDRRFVPAQILADVPWICSMSDLAFPRGKGGRESLVSLALAHDIGVASAHRASADVDILARLLTRVHDMGVDLVPFLRRGMRPKAVFVVADRGFDEARNALATVNGFEWDKPRAPRQWSRNMAIEDAATLPFDVRRIEG